MILILIFLCDFHCIVKLFHQQWAPGKARSPDTRVFTIEESSKVFSEYFDKVQEQLETLASVDDLLSGMYYSSKYSYFPLLIAQA